MERVWPALEHPEKDWLVFKVVMINKLREREKHS